MSVLLPRSKPPVAHLASEKGNTFISANPDAAVAIAPSRWLFALGIAAMSDGLSVPLDAVVPVQWGVDAITAVLLFFILKRPLWLFLPLICEAIPGVMLFPTWLLVVGMLWAGKWGQKK